MFNFPFHHHQPLLSLWLIFRCFHFHYFELSLSSLIFISIILEPNLGFALRDLQLTGASIKVLSIKILSHYTDLTI